MRFRLLARAFTGLLFVSAGTAAWNPASAQQEHRPTAVTVSAASLRVPAKARKHYDQARLAAVANRKEECAAHIQKALEIDPDFADVYLLRAIQETGAHQFEAALADALTALVKDPTIAWARIVVAESYNGMARYKEASQILANLKARDAETWQAKYEMARSAIGLGDTENALRMSEITLKVIPARRIDGHLLRANALQMAHRWEESVTEFEAYLASDQPQLQRQAVLGVLAETRKNIEREATEMAASK